MCFLPFHTLSLPVYTAWLTWCFQLLGKMRWRVLPYYFLFQNFWRLQESCWLVTDQFKGVHLAPSTSRALACELQAQDLLPSLSASQYAKTPAEGSQLPCLDAEGSSLHRGQVRTGFSDKFQKCMPECWSIRISTEYKNLRKKQQYSDHFIFMSNVIYPSKE